MNTAKYERIKEGQLTRINGAEHLGSTPRDSVPVGNDGLNGFCYAIILMIHQIRSSMQSAHNASEVATT